MTIKTSGSLSFSEINATFGRGTNLNAYRGTSWVSAGSTSGTFNVNGISFAEFYGKAPFNLFQGNISFSPNFFGSVGGVVNQAITPGGRIISNVNVNNPGVTFVCNGSPAQTFIKFQAGGGRPGTTCTLLIDGVFSGSSTDYVDCADAFRFSFTNPSAVANTTRFVRIEVYP